MPKKKNKKQRQKGRSTLGSTGVNENENSSHQASTALTPNQFQTQLEQLFQTRPRQKTSKPQPNQHNKLQSNDLYQGIFFVHNFLTAPECQQLIHLTEALGYAQTNQQETRFSAHRRNGRIQCFTAQVASQLFKRCRHLFPSGKDAMQPVGLSSNFRFYKYQPGDRFGMHVDDSNEVEEGITCFTLLVYLNQNLTGGSTKFYTGSNPKKARLVLEVQPEEGGALAHEHFPHCLLHEGSQVEQGIKYLMRTDVVFS
jgi:hypothetical protein